MFDTNSLTWGQRYNATTKPFQVPSNISKAIANITSPASGFTDSRVAALFSKRPAAGIDNSTTGGGPGGKITRFRSPVLSRSAIIGVTIGAVVFLTLAIGLICCYTKGKGLFCHPRLFRRAQSVGTGETFTDIGSVRGDPQEFQNGRYELTEENMRKHQQASRPKMWPWFRDR